MRKVWSPGSGVSVTLPRAAAIVLVTTLVTVALTCVAMRAGFAQSRGFDHAGYIRTWQDIYESVSKENVLIDELNQDVKANPPGRVWSARRIEIWDDLITEHERQLADFKKLRAAER